MSSPVKFDAILDGEIIEFWLDLYMAVWHKVGVKVRAISPVSQIVLWEKDIRGEQTNVLFLGIPPEFEKVISQALTKALNRDYPLKLCKYTTPPKKFANIAKKAL